MEEVIFMTTKTVDQGTLDPFNTDNRGEIYPDQLKQALGNLEIDLKKKLFNIR